MSDGLQGYELREKVATDHLGEIWLALRKEPAGLVRVRIVTFQPLNELSVRPRYVDGVRAAFRIRHPGLVPGVEAGVDEDRAFSVVEWPDGQTLGSRLRREGRLTQAEALKIAGEAAEALAAAWSAGGAWHGHLTPECIHLWPEGRVSVLDLGQTGIETLRSAGQVADFLRLLRSVPFYSAPELVRGAASVDFRSDIYSLGALLYHLMTGSAPFGDRPPAEALDKHLMGFLDDPCELNRDLSRGAGWLIEKMMSRDPSRRHADWASVRADLAAVRNGGDPAGQRPEAGASVIRRGAKRDPGLSAALRQPGTPGRRGGRRSPGAGGGRGPKVVVAGPTSGTPALSVSSSGSGSGARLAIIGAVLVLGGFLGVRAYMKRNQITVERPRPADEIARENARPPGGVRPLRPESPQGVAPTMEEIMGRRSSPAPSAPMQMDEIAVVHPAPATTAAPAAPVEKDPLFEHPRFKQAAGLFNVALGLFRDFETSRNPSQLDRVASMSEEAARLFEQCEAGFPGDRRVRKYVEQCYGLARFARQSLLSSGSLTDGRSTHPATMPLPPPPSSVQGGVLARPPSAPPPSPAPSITESLKLGPAWNSPIRVGASLVRELRDLLQSHGRPAVDTDPKPGLLIHPSVPYLEKMDQVTRRLGIPPMGGTGEDLTFPGFPERSLRYFGFESNSANPPYKSGRLIVDTFGHAVGVQWMDETPAGALTLPEEMFAAKWSIYDPIAGRIRERPSHRIAHRVRTSNGVVQIDTEVMDPSAPPAARSIGRYSLQLAQPVVDLMLMRMNASAAQ